MSGRGTTSGSESDVLPFEASAARHRGAMPRLSGLFRRYRGRILGVYGLFNLENLLRLAQPIALGWAIDGLQNGSWVGVAVLALQHLAALALTSSRQAIDTRVFGGIYADLVVRRRAGAARPGRAASARWRRARACRASSSISSRFTCRPCFAPPGRWSARW